MCQEFIIYLPFPKYSVKHDSSVDWCGFICFLLKDTNIHQNYGGEICRFILTEWWPW